MLRQRVQSQPIAILAVAIFSVGLITRLGLLSVRDTPDSSIAEPFRIALSLLRNGTYADAYGPNSGPTAHAAPLLSLILAGILHIAGTGASGRMAISVIASAAAALGYSFLPMLSAVCRFGIFSGFLAGMAGALIPVNYWAQTSGIFDAPYTLLALLSLCCLLGRCWVRDSFTVRDGAIFGAVAGMACLLNPTVLPVLFAWLIVGAWCFRHKAGEFLRYFAIVGICVVAALAPWAIRNYKTFGKPIWTRSNFGLELQLSNNDRASADLEKNMRDAGKSWPHPFVNEAEREKVMRMGEPAYFEARQRQALEWIAGHPYTFARLTLQRIVYFWFPPMRSTGQTFIEAVLTILGLGGVVYLLKTRHAARWLFAAVLASYPAVYYMIEASPRYRCPIEPLLFLLGCYWLAGSHAARTDSELGTCEVVKVNW